MNKLWIALIFLVPVIAKSQSNVKCGTPNELSPWLEDYIQHPEKFADHSRSDEVYLIPITIHSVGADDGSGHLDQNKILDGLCQANIDFEPYNIQFYLYKDIQYINRSRYYEHKSSSEGQKMIRTYKVPNSLNLFIVKSFIDNVLGYYSFAADGMVVIKKTVGDGFHTITHEMGHNLSLPHTFSGWENFEQHEIPVEQSAPSFLDIIGKDTSFVELIDGSNCLKAADRFCDTPADYLSFGWSCNSSGMSEIEEIDPKGNKFRSDGSYYMSYSNDGCQNQFSPLQSEAMRDYILFAKPYYLNQKIEIQDVFLDEIQLNYPINKQQVKFQDIHMEWEHVTNATHYLVQISKFSFFASVDYEFVVESNFLDIDELPIDKTYYWRIMPYNAFDVCNSFSEIESFKTANTTLVEEISPDNTVDIFPSLVLTSHPFVNINFDFSEVLETKVELYNSAGQRIYDRNFRNPATSSEVLDLSNQTPGLYLLRISNREGRLNKKILVQ